MTPDVAVFLDRIQELLEAERYLWAHDALRGIARTVRLANDVTIDQHRAVANIEAGIRQDVLPSQRLGGSRRYEGRPNLSRWQ